MSVDITGIDKIRLLNILWANAKQPGCFSVHANPMPPGFSEAAAKVAVTKYINYFQGKAIKMDLSGNTIEPHLYDRDFAPGTVAAIVQAINNI